MLRPIPVVLVALVFYCTGCINGGNQQPNTGDNVASPQTKSEPDSNDLLDALQGKWQSEQDSTYLLEISGSKMRHFSGGNMSFEDDIEVDVNCKSTPCMVGRDSLIDGWCFVEKGQFDAQCNLVVQCDKKVLYYRALGAMNGGLKFKRVNTK